MCCFWKIIITKVLIMHLFIDQWLEKASIVKILIKLDPCFLFPFPLITRPCLFIHAMIISILQSTLFVLHLMPYFLLVVCES